MILPLLKQAKEDGETFLLTHKGPTRAGGAQQYSRS